MKYFLLFWFLLLPNCSEQGQKKADLETPHKPESKYRSTEDYALSVGMAHVLEHKLEGYELKAAIVNSFHSLLFYYNAELEQVCFYIDENLISQERQSMKFEIKGQEKIGKIHYFLTDGKENCKIISIDRTQTTQEEYEKIQESGWSIASGFKLKQTDTYHFSITLADSLGTRQDVEVSYDPNNGWGSKASDITLGGELISANIFAFGKEKIIDQISKIAKIEPHCIVKTFPHPRNQFLKLEWDHDFIKPNKYSIEIEIQGENIIINGERSGIYDLRNRKEKFNSNDLNDVRITLTKSSNDETVRELLKYLEYSVRAKYFIGIK